MSRGEASRRLASIVIVLATIAVACATAASYVAVHYEGTIKGIGVGIYRDVGCTQILCSVDTGSLSPGAVINTTAYIRNEGNQTITLSLQTWNWTPSNASDYISLAWDYNGLPVAVNYIIGVVLSLSVSPNIEGISTFGFDAVVTRVN